MPRSVLKCCAVWLAALALTPFTAPFAVINVTEIVGQATSPNSLPPWRDELQAWWIDGESVLDLPLVPIAAEVRSFTPVLAAVPVVAIGSAPLSNLPIASTRQDGSQPLVAVLRL